MSNHLQGSDKRHKERRTDTDRRGSEGERRVRHKQHQRNNGIGTLVFLCIISIIALSIFVAFQTDVGDDIDWGKMFFLKDKSDNTFKMGGVSLGMTQKTVKQLHPNMDLASLGHGESTATFVVDGGNYTIWFIDLKGLKSAYRMRYDQTFATRTEAEILDKIGSKYGKPVTSECIKVGFDPRKCVFQWWPSSGIALNVSTTEIDKSSGKRHTQVTIIATDTYLNGKRLRMRNIPVTIEPSKESSENLPF
ncbi:MAG: hypothetical protein HQ504_10145 [Rhodospirillaceae bacterium]|nr:hypothetical protein [Rhodospirillaceae bacterium]